MDAPKSRLLVVDDDENNRDMLARRLERRGYDVAVAIDGADCLAKVQTAGKWDLILLDVMMPGISGLDVLKQLRRKYPPTELPIIMATAKSEREDIVEALSLGANDYVTKPLDFPVVVARVEAALTHKRAVDRILALERDLQNQNKQLADANDRMHRDLRLAARMQQSLLPHPTSHAGVRFAWNYRPCDELGGDILNVFPLGEDHIGLYLLDVSGHGVPAALLSVTLSRILAPIHGQASLVEHQTATGLAPTPPAEVLAELNRRFQVTPENDQYFTLVYALLHRPSGELHYAAAGHPPAIHISTARQTRELEIEAFPIGWVPDATYEQFTLPLVAGDRVLIYSDGATESMNEADEEFGRQRLTEALLEKPLALDETLTHVRCTVEAYCAKSRIVDDISLLALEWV